MILKSLLYIYIIPKSKPDSTMGNEIHQFMKGILIEKTGGVEVLHYRTDIPVPTVHEGQVLIKNSFAGINYIDMYMNPKAKILY